MSERTNTETTDEVKDKIDATTPTNDQWNVATNHLFGKIHSEDFNINTSEQYFETAFRHSTGVAGASGVTTWIFPRLGLTANIPNDDPLKSHYEVMLEQSGFHKCKCVNCDPAYVERMKERCLEEAKRAWREEAEKAWEEEVRKGVRDKLASIEARVAARVKEDIGEDEDSLRRCGHPFIAQFYDADVSGRDQD